MNRSFISLLEGNATHVTEFESKFRDVQDGQEPAAVTVCCSDSRVLQDHIWANDEPGQVFTCGNIGNRVMDRTASGDVVSGDVLYPVAHTGTETAIVVGHTGCGAVTATYDDVTHGIDEPDGIRHCIDQLETYLEPGVESLPDDLDRDEAINRLVEYNVDRQVEFLVESDEVPDDVDVVGVVYDFQDVYTDRRGEVHVVNVDGETDVASLRERYPAIAERTRRLWEY